MAQIDAAFLFRLLVDYEIKMNEQNCYDVVKILDGYDREVLSNYKEFSPLAKRWSSMIKEYRRLDPRGQSKLSGFY
ncbi:MAG TPA: hypothetical protein VF172_11065 [Nitrososphaera sp.]|jgi:hypothetical protein